MYYYYAVTKQQKCNVIQYNDIIGRCDTKAKEGKLPRKLRNGW